MAIRFPVPPRTLLLCDYSLGGFRPPEMVKRRPVVVVSPRSRHASGLLTVVPLSTTPPDHPGSQHCSIHLPLELPGFPERDCWAKADMVAAVSFGRLDMFRTERAPDGQRRYLTPKLPEADFALIQAALRAALGL